MRGISIVITRVACDRESHKLIRLMRTLNKHSVHVAAVMPLPIHDVHCNNSAAYTTAIWYQQHAELLDGVPKVDTRALLQHPRYPHFKKTILEEPTVAEAAIRQCEARSCTLEQSCCEFSVLFAATQLSVIPPQCTLFGVSHGADADTACSEAMALMSQQHFPIL